MTDGPRRPPAAAILVVPLVVALVLTLFAWPAARVAPRDLPVGVVGASALQQRALTAGGRFAPRSYPNEAAARAAIEDREVYGAFVVTPRGAKVLVASGGSQLVAQALPQVAPDAPVEDVAPAPPASAALAASVLPLVIAGILTGVLSSLLAAGPWQRVGLVVAASVLTGLVAALIVQSWLDVIGGRWLVNAAALGLTVLAIAATVAGLEALLGRPGIALGALTMVLVGNPFSGVPTSPDMLPSGAGTLGQLLPPGAGGNLLRSTGYFDGGGAGGHVAVLAVWVLIGSALLAVGALRTRPAAAPA